MEWQIQANGAIGFGGPNLCAQDHDFEVDRE
jgi:hypothetical protein